MFKPSNWTVALGSSEELLYSAAIYDFQSDEMIFEFEEIDQIKHFATISVSEQKGISKDFFLHVDPANLKEEDIGNHEFLLYADDG